MTAAEEPTPSDKVGFRDIYRAVGESESRIKEHISLVLLPITAAVADHETRLRTIEDNVAVDARSALKAATLLADEQRALSARVDAHDDLFGANAAAGIERRRIGGITVKGVGLIVLVTNFIIGTAVVIVNLLTKTP